MTEKGEVDRVVAEAKPLLSQHGYDCQATAEDLILWFQADTPFDEDFGLDREAILDRYRNVLVEEVSEKSLEGRLME